MNVEGVRYPQRDSLTGMRNFFHGPKVGMGVAGSGVYSKQAYRMREAIYLHFFSNLK